MSIDHPTTAVPWCTGLVGLSGFAVGFAFTCSLRPWPALAMLVLLTCTAAPMWWAEYRRLGSPRTHRQDDDTIPVTARRGWRLRGLLIAAPLWALTLNVLPLAASSHVSGFWAAVSQLWPLLAAALVAYVWRPSTGAPDGLELAGQWMHRPEGNRFPAHVLRDHLVKAFFLPLMVSFAYTWASQTDGWDAPNAARTYASTIALLYLIDTTFAAVGYMSTTRALDAHVRSSNPSWLGWGSTLVCYPPFFAWLQDAGFNYRDDFSWSDWLPPSSLIFHTWGLLIVALTAVYAFSTVVFGIRFSNLTHRGILTHGPYRWTKHPAYLSKNLSWWLISIPFISSAGAVTASAHCAILLCVNCTYWLRAKTEERHLMVDPAYRAYAAWISKHGLFARLTGGRIRSRP